MQDVLGPRQRLPEVVADALQQEILSAGLKQGERLPTEPELAERYRVSRTVVREAARLLVQRGLVTVRPGRGMTVAEVDGRFIAEQYGLLIRLSEGTFTQLLELRLVLEVEIAALAAARRTPEQVVALQESNRRLVQARGSREAFLTADLAFHELMAEASGNPFFPLVVGPINGFLRDVYSSGPGYPSEADHTVEEHGEIAVAIGAGDADGARFQTERHLRRIIGARNKLMAKAGDDTSPAAEQQLPLMPSATADE
jgi:GntR family transcriptional regulator, transcriptional repressor for pyruvate dehydrogenase complex